MPFDKNLLASCPVKPLGISQDNTRCYYEASDGRTIAIPVDRHFKLPLCALFAADIPWLEHHFPQWTKPERQLCPDTHRWVETQPSRVTTFNQASAAEWLVTACAHVGPVRGSK